MTKFSDKKKAQEKAKRAKELPERVEQLDGRIDALVVALEEVHSRLDKLEVVKVPSPTTTEPEPPDEEQLPQTE